jgi:hypothetical protein
VAAGYAAGIVSDSERPLGTGLRGNSDRRIADRESCPVFPGKRYEDWTVADPKGQDLDTVRGIVDDVNARVQALLADLGVRESGRGSAT